MSMDDIECKEERKRAFREGVIVGLLACAFFGGMWIFTRNGSKKDFDTWAIHFSNGSEIAIKAPDMIDIGKTCASDKFFYLDGQGAKDNILIDAMKRYTVADGYVFHQHRHDGNHDVFYTICKPLSKTASTAGGK